MFSMKHIPAFLVTLLFLLGSAFAETNTATALRGEQPEARNLQSLIEYVYNVELFFTLDPDFVPTGAERLDEVRDIVRLTQNFYRRTLAQAYAREYWQVTCIHTGGENDIRVDVDALGRITLAFDVIVTSTYRMVGNPPTEAEGLAAVSTFDRTTYLTKFVWLARPGDFAPS